LLKKNRGKSVMQCPECGQAELIRDTRDIPYTYKGQCTLISDVTGDYCPECGEAVFDPEQSHLFNTSMLEFNKRVNAEAVDPNFIATVRKSLGLDQQQAAEIFGGGVNAFSRYETGRSMPPLSLIQLFKILERHPSLLSELVN